MEKSRHIAGMLLLLALCTMAHAETYICDNCSDCTAKIGSASYGDEVQLTADISSTDMDCITFTGKTGVSLDCQGHSLEGNLTDYGIYLNTGSGNTVKNCVVTSYSHGIHLYNSDYNTIMNNTADSNRFIGIYALSSDENTFDENVASYNSGGGGIFLAYCQGNNITNNEADQNSEYGIQLYFSANSTLTGNTASSNRYGIYFMYSSDNTANLNYACGQNVSDVYIGGTSTNSGDENTCTTDGGWNDTGTSGCTYGCPGTTTTTTTTTTSSTTTTTTTSTTTTVPEIFFCNPPSINPSTGEIDCPIVTAVDSTLDQIDQQTVTISYAAPSMVLLTNFTEDYSELKVFGRSDMAYESDICLLVRADLDSDGTYENKINESCWFDVAPLSWSIDLNITTDTSMPLLFYPTLGSIAVDYIGPAESSATTTSTSSTVTSTSTSTSTSTTVTLPENMCWSEDMGFLYRTKYQARKFCKCAMGTYGYETYSESSGERATYSYVDTGDNDEWETSCTQEYNQIFRVKCTDSIWYYTDEDYYLSATSTTTTSSSSTSSTASSTTTSTTMPCSLAGDYPPCDEILLSEIVAHINLWAAGEAPLSEVVALVNAWAS